MKKEENTENKIPKKSFKESVTLLIRKKWLSSTAQTIALVVVLISIFLAINIYVQSLDIETIDVTKNKLYSLSDASKEAIGKINKDVTINYYGIDEGSILADFLEKYASANDHIKVVKLDEQTNLEKVQKYDLTSGYQIIVLECGETSKLIDASYELASYDYTTGQEVDLTEQVLTNSILAISSDSKPKVYFTTGHKEYDLTGELSVLNSYLGNEAYQVSSINLLTEGRVPEDCDLLVIMAPVSDFLEQEVESVLNYINAGGNMLLTSDVGNTAETYPNLTRVYDMYGVKMNHVGYIYEKDSKFALSNYPNIFIPQISATNDITESIYKSGSSTLWLVYAGRLEFKSEEELKAMNVEAETLLASSDTAMFITDITKAPAEAAESAEKGQSIISSIITRTISEASEETGTEAVKSTAVVIANATFVTDYKVEQLSQSYPMSYFSNNRDFILNSIATLTKKDNGLKIRKDMSSSTYAPTEQEHKTVMLIIFVIPITIILAGVAVGYLRKRKK